MSENLNILPPHSEEAEEAVITAVLSDNDLYLDADLSPEDFYFTKNGKAWLAIQQIVNRGDPFDEFILADQLKANGDLEAFGGLGRLTCNIAYFESPELKFKANVRIIRETATRRRLIEFGTKTVQFAFSPDGKTSEELFADTAQRLFTIGGNLDDGRPKQADEVMDKVLSTLEKMRAAGNLLTGIPTGLTDLDLKTGGLQRSDMIVIAGRPGMGKSALAMQIAINAVEKHGKRCLIFSLEMPAPQLLQRVLATKSNINLTKLRCGNVSDDEYPAVIAASSLISGLEDRLIITDAGNLTVEKLRSIAMREYYNGLDMIVIDYLQLLNGRDDAYQRVTEISRQCKLLARELDIPVIVLSQLNRAVENRQDKRPQLSDLRESGAIEQDADVVILLYRAEMYEPDGPDKHMAELIIAKQRSGPTGVIRVGFQDVITRFIDLAEKTISFSRWEV